MLDKRNKTRIIRVTTVSQSLGFCREVMLKMRALGYEIMAVSSPGEYLDKLRDNDGFHIAEVPMERHISLVKDMRSLLAMFRVLRREKPHIVHSATPKAGLITMVAAKLARVPIRIHTFTGLVWPTSIGIKRKVLIFTDWLTCACATHINPEGFGVMRDLKKISNKPMQVLGYGNIRGVDMVRFSRRPEIRNRASELRTEGLLTFLFVGRVVADKGVNEMLEAFVKLHGVKPNTRLIVVGRFEPELDPLSEEAFGIINNSDFIDAVGPQGGDELISYYASSDCLLLPSYREGFPNTVLEAGAMGLPSIVSDINGANEIIIEGENGLIIPPKNAEALFNAMMTIIENESLRKKMSENARQLIESRFEKSYVENCLVEYYKSIEE